MGNRQCTIDVKNQTMNYSLNDRRVYMYSGTCVSPLPSKVRPDEEGSGLFTKTSGAACGSVGIFTYDLSHNDSPATVKLAVMFSVPFNYNFYHHNYYAVGICGQDKPCDYNLYWEMTYGDPTWFFRCEAGRPLNYEGDHISMKAAMTDNKLSTLTVEVVEPQVIMSKSGKFV